MTAAAALTALLAVFSGLLLLAAIEDLARLRISNPWPVAIFLVGAAALIIGGPPLWWQHLIAFAAVLAFGILLHNLQWIGGGDAKLFAAAALAFDLWGTAWFLASAMILGGLIALVSITVRMALPAGTAGKGRKAVPYGVAIAAGALASAYWFPIHSAFAP